MKQTCWAARLIFFAFGLGISSWAPMIPFVKTKLELDDAQLGLIFLVFGIGALVMMPITGWLVGRLGSRLMTLISGLFVLASLPLLTVADTPFTLSFVLFIFGAVTGAMNIAINAQAVSIESKSATAVMSGFHCLFSTGGLFGAVIISLFLEWQWSLWNSALVVSSIMFLILISQWRNLIAENHKSQTTSTTKTITWPETKLIFLGVLCFIAFMAEGSMLDWSAEFLTSSLHYEASIAGIGYAIFSIAMAFGRLLGDKFIQRFGALLSFQLGSLLAAAGFLILINISWGYGELFGFFLIGLGASNIVPILFSASGKLGSSSPNYSLTVVTTMGYLGILFGPAVIGFIAKATNLSFAFSSVALLLIAIGLSGRAVLLAPSPQSPSINE